MKRQIQQYTLRRVPAKVDAVLRRKSQKEGKSFNQIAIEALTAGSGLAEEPILYHDLDALAGTWVEDEGFDEAIRSHDQVDNDLWKR